MFFKRIILLWIIIGGTFGSTLIAQSMQSENWLRFDDVKRSNGWLCSENAAGLTVLDVRQVSEASLMGIAKLGDLHNSYDSDKEYIFKAGVSSYYRLSDRIVVGGGVEYLTRDMDAATGSYFIDPEQNPFDLLEFTADNPGDKKYEKYRVSGGIGADLNHWLSLGAGMDYIAADYAKRKDLRHINSLLDMTVTVGSVFRPNERFSVGADYVYRRRNESLLLSMYGTTDKIYTSLLSYGAFFGKRETFGEIGYTKENESKPLFDEYHGGAIQLSWKISRNLDFFNELGYRVRNGYYGEPSPRTVVYSEHEGSQFQYKGFLDYKGLSYRHVLQMNAEFRDVDNNENIYSYVNEDTGLSYIDYIGTRDVGTRSQETLSLIYTGSFNVQENLPEWQISFKGNYSHREIKAFNYPDYRIQDISWWQINTTIERNILKKRDCYTFLLGCGYGAGNGDAAKDGTYVSSGSSETVTRTSDNFLMQEYEYLTASQFNVQTQLGITRPLGGNNVKGYISLEYIYRKAFDTVYSGNGQRHTVSLQIGCLF